MDKLNGLLLVVCLISPVLILAHTEDPLPPDPATTLDVKLVGVTECAAGWERISVDRGFTIYYPHTAGAMVPQWIDEATLRAAFTTPNGTVITDSLGAARRSLRSQPRVICRWAPLTVGGGAAD